MTAIVTRLLAEAGAPVDLEHTIVVHQIWNNQVRGSVSIPPTASCLDCTFRIYRKQRTTLADLVEWGSMKSAAANALAATSLGKVRRLISGEPGSGKSTVTAALASIHRSDRWAVAVGCLSGAGRRWWRCRGGSASDQRFVRLGLSALRV